MVGEPPSWWREPVTLGPGKYVVYDKHGRRFTTANDKGYAERLAERLGGSVSIDAEE